jgi:hypothetical protein
LNPSVPSRSSVATEVHRVFRNTYATIDVNLGSYSSIEDFLDFSEMAKKFNTDEFVRGKPSSEE